MPQSPSLAPVSDLVGHNRAHFPNESADYRRARNELLAAEIELRRHMERVSQMRRRLPPGGEVTREYRFEGENRTLTLAQLFGEKDTLVIYSYMFGPRRERPCPMCTSFMSTWEGKWADVEQRIALAFVARSPIDRLLAARESRGWTRIKVYSDADGSFTRDYVNPDDADVPGFNVFTRRDGRIRHFYAGEMNGAMADPGQDPRGAPDLDPLWLLLDMTPGGRGSDWYPKLEYGTE